MIVGMFSYRMLYTPAVDTFDTQSALVVGEDLLKLSNALSQAKLSKELFAVPGYLFLTDLSVPIPQQTFGRPNPFNVIGRD